MSKRFILLALVVIVSFSIVGCVTRLVDFTIISTKNIDLARGADFKRGPSRVEGEDKVSIIIIIPTGTPNIKEAVDRAIEKVPGAIALLDGVVYAKGWWIPYIYGESSYAVEGTPLIDPKLVASKLPSNYIVSRLDKKGNVIATKYVTKAEYDSVKKKIHREI
jgi:hypothetical protein